MSRAPDIGRHVASLNLFLEADGKLYLTVAGGDAGLIRRLASERGLKGRTPADMAVALSQLVENRP